MLCYDYVIIIMSIITIIIIIIIIIITTMCYDDVIIVCYYIASFVSFWNPIDICAQLACCESSGQTPV